MAAQAFKLLALVRLGGNTRMQRKAADLAGIAFGRIRIGKLSEHANFSSITAPDHTTKGPLPIENRKTSPPSAHRATIVVPASVPTGIAPPLRRAHARIAA